MKNLFGMVLFIVAVCFSGVTTYASEVTNESNNKNNKVAIESVYKALNNMHTDNKEFFIEMYKQVDGIKNDIDLELKENCKYIIAELLLLSMDNDSILDDLNNRLDKVFKGLDGKDIIYLGAYGTYEYCITINEGLIELAPFLL